MVASGMIAVIPARGGSKRIPRKNIVDFCGKPLIAWTIEAALQSDIFDMVLVSTDDEDIADISRHYGAQVPFLRRASADDISPVSLATLDALDQLAERCRASYDIVMQLMPNCPLRTASDILAAKNHFDARQADFQLSCFQYSLANPFWAVTLDSEGNPSALFPEAFKSRSQDLPKLYCPTGAIWIARSEPLKKAATFYGPGHRFFELSWRAAIDIDTEDDLTLARAVAQTSFAK
ncbi:cytidylyltransferase domain-containing protein [Dongia soli]|uniref:Acylneuraminate cytidylyltransferase family protein n=1 Tax=Dongia soli TaxID=600628 RepID=A0ABU5EAR4_9PROT|nr:acylneuraminate cytidylyltransferase family protein [Dongia soli]MDY0883241.1 acylneuraminate cytidylyltransferase family protein [Dongia soli]